MTELKMKELLINKGFEVEDLDGAFRIYYKKGECFETLRKLREIIPCERIDTYNGFLEIVFGY